jgi:hypothetical protein
MLLVFRCRHSTAESKQQNLRDNDINAKHFDSAKKRTSPGADSSMNLRNNLSFRLGAEEAAFLRIEHLSILAASHGPDNLPFVARALGRRLAKDSERITLFFPASDAQDLLSNVAGNGMIAVIFALPSTHQALQLKGTDAKVERPAKSDFKLTVSYRHAFADHLTKLGYPGQVFEALLDCEPDDLRAVTFTPSAAFSQTPGPGAGRAIGATT